MEGQQPQKSMVQLWHNFLWCQQVYWPALHSEHLRECSSKMWWGLLSLKGLDIFRLKLKAGDLIFYWLTWLSWRCLIVCAGDLCAPHPRAVHLCSNFMHWGLKNRNDLLWFICFLPLQPCENWLDYLGRCGRMSEEEADPGFPMWEGQPVLSALCCHTGGSWPYLPQFGTCSPGKVDSLVFVNLPYLVNSFPGPEHTHSPVRSWEILCLERRRVLHFHFSSSAGSVCWTSNLTGVSLCDPLVGFRTVNLPATITDPKVTIFRVGTYIDSRSWSQTTYTSHMRPSSHVLLKGICINYSSKCMRCNMPRIGSLIAMFFKERMRL